MSDEQRHWRLVFEDLRRTLRDAQAERHQREDWIDFERTTMVDRVNLLRARGGFGPVSTSQVEAKERLACGHVDYTQKFAIYCADLVIEGTR